MTQASVLETSASLVSGKWRVTAPFGAPRPGARIESHFVESISDRRRAILQVFRSESENDATREANFRRAAGQLAAIEHPNIVGVLEHGIFEGRPYLVRELAAGQSLEAILERGTRFTPEEATPILAQLCEAIEFAHDQGLVHGELSPARIIIDRDERVRITDFGTCEPELARRSIYAAPELIEGAVFDRRIDLYALGVIAHQMIAGRYPEPGVALAEAAGLDPARARFAAIVDRLLAADPLERCSSARWVAHAFRVSLGMVALGDQAEGATIFAPELQQSAASDDDLSAAKLTMFLWLEKGWHLVEPKARSLRLGDRLRLRERSTAIRDRFDRLPGSRVHKFAALGAIQIVLLLVVVAIFSRSPVATPIEQSAEEIAHSARTMIAEAKADKAIETLERAIVEENRYGIPVLHAALAHGYAHSETKSLSLQHFAVVVKRDPSALEEDDVRDLVSLLALPKPHADQAEELLRALGDRARPALLEATKDKAADKNVRKRAKSILAPRPARASIAS